MKLKSRVVLDGPCDDDYDDFWASLSTVRESKMKISDRLNFDTLIIQYNAAIRKVQRLQDLMTDGRTEELGILGG